MNREYRPPAENPFASRYTRPGAMPYLFPPGDSADAVVARFVGAGRRGAIVGPHGSGKSTLLEELLPRLRASGCEPRVFVLRDGERNLSARFADGLQTDAVLTIDGYEQLGWWGRRTLFRAVDRVRCGLLLTSHDPVRSVPTLTTMRPTVEATLAVVEHLTAGPLTGRIAPADVRRLFDEQGGNVREVLFSLYDLYESRRL